MNSWRTTLLGIAAATAGLLAQEGSPLPEKAKPVAQAAAWVLVGLTGKVAKDHAPPQAR